MKTTDKDTFVALDIATTGMDPENDGIVEIAVIRFNCAGDVSGVFDTLLDPGIPISAEESALHHITDGMVAGEPPPLEVWDMILNKFSSSLFIVHNAPLDVSFLKNLQSSNPKMEEIRFVDVLEMHRDRYPYSGSYSLYHLASDEDEPYRARTGAISTAAIFKKIMKTRKRKDIPDTYIQYAKDIKMDEPSKRLIDYVYDLNDNPTFARAKQKAGNYIKRVLGNKQK